MNRILKILFSLVLGAWAALIAWVIRSLVLGNVAIVRENPYFIALLDGGTVGLLAGAMIAGLEKFNNTSRMGPTLVGTFTGFLTGLIGGTAGLLFAEVLFQNTPVPAEFQQALRIISWGIFGLGVGLGPGIATGSLLKAAAGSIGGCLGGMMGGGIFIALLTLLASYVSTSQAIGFTLLGLFVGLFIALAHEAVNQATLKITEQRIAGPPGEGRTFQVTKKRVRIGRADKDDWVISNDPNILPYHAEIRQEGGQFILYSTKPQTPVFLRGQPVLLKQVLNDNDRFTIGATTIAFSSRKK